MGTLLEIMEQNVHPGSIIHTDCWRGYSTPHIQALEMQHRTVNHDANFVDPITGVHTNTIETEWAALKRRIAPRRRTQTLIIADLLECVWRQRNSEDLWLVLLRVVNDDNYVTISLHKSYLYELFTSTLTILNTTTISILH